MSRIEANDSVIANSACSGHPQSEIAPVDFRLVNQPGTSTAFSLGAPSLFSYNHDIPFNPPKLLGKYKTPKFSFGDEVHCARRGEVPIVGLSSAPIPWTIGKRLPKGRQRSLVLEADLTETVRRESAEAVAYWFGVKSDAVWHWASARSRRAPPL
jgi:hypothetical protein